MTGTADLLRSVLAGDLSRPVFLTLEEAQGGWISLFPELAGRLPAPYPIFAPDEERIVERGYPVLHHGAMKAVAAGVQHLVAVEIPYRVALAEGAPSDKSEVTAAREEWRRRLVPLLENAVLSDSGRHLPELLALAIARTAAELLDQVPVLVARRRSEVARRHGETIRFQIARTLADQLHRASLEAGDRLRSLAPDSPTIGISPVVHALRTDLFPLARRVVESDPHQLEGWAALFLKLDPERFRQSWRAIQGRIESVLAEDLGLRAAVALLAGGASPGARPALVFEPRLWTLLETAGLKEQVAGSRVAAEGFQRLGTALKRSEVLMALRDRVLPVQASGPRLALTGRSPVEEISPSTRPYDFGRPGVVDTAVHRFGLTYDLVSFTAELEEIRKAGRAAEEKALRFMYLFQEELRTIADRHRLRFEKFLGDGAFYSARRAIRALAGACEIQRLYERLRVEGFPFTRGIRIALNFGTYHLFAMPTASNEPPRYEFFGHGIVELSRLTTGKSGREVEEIAEFLIHSGYSEASVEAFLRPLLEGHGDGRRVRERRYAAWLDGTGGLVNNGIVLTAPFLEELEGELPGEPAEVEFDGLRWLAWRLETAGQPLSLGLRYLGVPHLKGLPPQELVEVVVWDTLPDTGREHPGPRGLLQELRSLAIGGDSREERAGPELPEDLVVVTYLVAGRRTWIFGTYRHEDDMLLNALEISLTPPDLQSGEPLEMWLFRNRFDLFRLYEGLRREVSGASVPMNTLRRRDGYVGCFLAAPHRAPA